ncbi:anthranilate phosphoribosyltransferase [Haliangium ochraceum]|uniref:Anthranilate phosphoribosyltransferase n=1 Tax=Haliangium ochraceum (strain DSM 14365 / JCM 11303 / SMP-2) TaxID=502025 RepID=D0LX41_HALO1|nr:anthranilate phosphoribosyltransferase [Haliangium ochraceum]ACY16083.1 anthranilate phosphoribosyltransferase [Haliangium ochraceum DSM 14365]
MDLKQAIAQVVAGRDLAGDEVAAVFDTIMAGEATPAQIGGLLIGLRMKGVSAAELAGAARAMRGRARAFRAPEPERAVDTCGTGGDGSGSVNVSTLAAIVAAGAGAQVAKHGNRALSSRSGSADVLEVLGVNIEASPETITRCMREAGIGFLFAPAFHAATRHAAGPRRELGTRTIFNLLGPLTNPAGARNQIVGVFDAAWCQPVAEALGQLGARRAFVVHGEGGIDEIAVRGRTRMAAWDEARGTVEVSEITPADFGLEEADPAGLAGGDAHDNARILQSVLAGEAGAVRNAAVMEAGVALVAAGCADDLRAGAELAAAAIDDGRARDALARWAALSQEDAA